MCLAFSRNSSKKTWAPLLVWNRSAVWSLLFVGWQEHEWAFECLLNAFDVGMLRPSQLYTEPSPKAVLASLVQRLSDFFITPVFHRPKKQDVTRLTKLRSQLKGFIEFIILSHESSANPNSQAAYRSVSPTTKRNSKNGPVANNQSCNNV